MHVALRQMPRPVARPMLIRLALKVVESRLNLCLESKKSSRRHDFKPCWCWGLSAISLTGRNLLSRYPPALRRSDPSLKNGYGQVGSDGKPIGSAAIIRGYRRQRLLPPPAIPLRMALAAVPQVASLPRRIRKATVGDEGGRHIDPATAAERHQVVAADQQVPVGGPP